MDEPFLLGSSLARYELVRYLVDRILCSLSADAIMRGLLKARKLDDPNTLDIDDENKMVLDKTGSKKVTSQQAAAASSQTKVNGH